MIPALQMRMSSLESRARICLEPVWMEDSEARSRGMKVEVTAGNWDLRFLVRVSAREAERPVKRMCAGEWAASVRTVFSPKPAVPLI
jgi:hypothetical protein